MTSPEVLADYLALLNDALDQYAQAQELFGKDAISRTDLMAAKEKVDRAKLDYDRAVSESTPTVPNADMGN